MVRGKSIQGNEKIKNSNSSDNTETQNNDDNTLPRGGPKKNISLSSSKPDDEQKTFPTQKYEQSGDEQQQSHQIHPKRGRGRPRKNPIATKTNNSDIDHNLSISNSESSSSSKINHHEELNENLNDSNDDQHNIISVIEIVDDSQDNSIIHHLEYSNESQNNQNDDNILVLDEENSQENDTNSIITEEIIDKSTNFEDDDDDTLEIEIIKKEPENFDVEAKINTESIITISSEDSNLKTEFKSDDASVTELNDRNSGDGGGTNDSVSSPDILHVYINPDSARTYQNKRKSKIDNLTNINLDNLSNNSNKLEKNNIIELKQYKQNKNIQIEENLQIDNDNMINSIECRRSSRKKTMKYDVRDLLNKNRKKIQIEARIDSLPKKLTDDNSTTTTIVNEIKIPDNNCSKLSPLVGIPKINELHDILSRKPENNPTQLNLINLVNDKKITHSPILLASEGKSPPKNLIQIQSKKSFENGSYSLPPPPPLKSIVELDKKSVTLPNGLYLNELNKNNKIYSFQDAFSSAIIKGGYNKNAAVSTSNLDAIETVRSTTSSMVVSVEQSTTATVVPPVLSSMVKSPLLNIKFKHQNLAIRKSFDSLVNTNSTTNNLNDDKITIKEIQSQLNIEDQTINSTLATEKIEEKTVKIKGKRGRPPKNKLLSPKIVVENSALHIKIENKFENLQNTEKNSIKQSENLNLIHSSSSQKQKIITSPKTFEKCITDNNLKGKQICEISPITKNTNLSPTNTSYSNALANFKFMESKVKIKRLSYRSSTESIDSNINNNKNNFTDCKKYDVIEKSDENKKHSITQSEENIAEKIVEKCYSNVEEPVNIMPQEDVVDDHTENQVSVDNINEKEFSTEELSSENEKCKLNKNKLREEKSTKSGSAKKKKHYEFEKVENLEMSPKNLKNTYKIHSMDKNKHKDLLKKEAEKLHSTERKHHKYFEKNPNKEEKTLLNKTKDKSSQNERKSILSKNKLFLETENIHELTLQKSNKKKALQNKDKEYTPALKTIKNISAEGDSFDQIKHFIEEKETKEICDALQIFEKSHEELTTTNNINDLKVSGEQVISDAENVQSIENEIISNNSLDLTETATEKNSSCFENIEMKISELESHEGNQYTSLKPQKENLVFEQLAEKLIENDINYRKSNQSSHKEDQSNKLILNQCEENVSSNSNVCYNNIQSSMENLDKNKIDTTIKIDENITTKIIQKNENTIQKGATDILKIEDNYHESNSSNNQKNETLLSTCNDNLSNEKELITQNEKNIPECVPIVKSSKDNKINTANETLSASSSTDSNDPLKDIEKFLEAAGNLLSRSLSSEDENESRRRSRTGTRFKDCVTKDDDDYEDNTDASDVDGLGQKYEKDTAENPTTLQKLHPEDDCNISTSNIGKSNLETKICKINKKSLINTVPNLTKTENLDKLSAGLPATHISVFVSTLNDLQHTSNNNDNSSSEFISDSIKKLPTDTNETLNFSHKFPSEDSENLSCASSQPVEKRTAGPRTPPFPPPNDLPIDEVIRFIQNSSKSEESLLHIENDSNTIASSLDFHSDSMTSNSSKSTDSKCLKQKSPKNSEDDLKLMKKLKRKDEKKLKKKDGITNELKRTIKEMKKMKKNSSDGNLIQGTLSKAAIKSYSPVNLIDNCKTDGDSQSLDDSIDMDENQTIYDQNNKNIRRSHRIKTITKSQSVGRGLVRDRDKEFDDIKPDLAVIEAQNAKFLKDMEERLSQFQVIRDNEYKCERVISKEAKKMICDCFLTREEEERGEFGCGEDCLNRLLMIECGPKCTVSDRCTNRRFQRAHYAPCKVFQTEKKGCGILADAEISSGQFIMEYVGEVLNSGQFEKRAEIYSQDKNKHYYFMALRSDAIIDATTRGNISRFINHSCDPNAETQKWTVNGELRIGFFTTRTILPGEEITFDYQFQRYGKEAQRCYCESSNCRGWIGEEPEDSDEEELDDESEDDEKIKTDVKKDILLKITKEIPNDQQFKPKSVQDISQKTDADDKENIELIKIKPKEEKVKKKRGRKKRLDFRLGKKNYEFIDDPDLEDEVLRLLESGLKNQVQTLCISRLFVRAKQLETRLNLLQILRKGEMSCRRLFLDYHGLKLLHGWMSETTELVKDTENDLKTRLNLLETLECLPIPNKTMLKDSKVFQTVQNWAQDKTSTESSPNDGSPNDNSNSGLTTPINVPKAENTSNNLVISSTEKSTLSNTNENVSIEDPIKVEIKRISTKLITIWDCLPEVFRIPRKERVEQMKEHEREADRQYAALKLVDDDNEIRRNRGRFIKDIKVNTTLSNNTDLTPNSGGSIGKYKWSRDIKNEIIKERRKEFEKSSHHDGLSKMQRRQIFAAKVAQDEAEKRLADEKREFDIKCKFYGLDPLTTNPRNFPFCVNPATGQWYTIDRRKIPTPPSHAHIKVPPKPQSTKPEDYQLPPLDLPPFWKSAIDPHKGRIYYYHMKIRIPQWEPPIKILPLNNGKGDVASFQTLSASNKDVQDDENDSSDSGSESSDSLNDKNKDETSIDGKPVQSLNPEHKKLERKKRRYALLVQERPISPRREEDRVYNQIEMRRYKENKEKIRRRKEEIKRRKIQLARQLTDQQNNSELETNNDNNEESITNDENIESDSGGSATSSSGGGVQPLPIADYLLSSDEEETITNFCDANLIEKIVKGEKIVDELDAININRPLKRLLSFKEKNSNNSNSTITSIEHKAKKSKIDEKKLKTDDEIKKPKSSSKLNNPKYLARKAKEKFRTDIAGIIVLHLTPYRKETCKTGRITKDEDFKHLARKLTHFVMVKELKHCDLTGQQLIVTDSVKNKSREFIKKYMAKYGEIYIRPENDPEFKEIPH